MSSPPLTDKQLRALRSCASPESDEGWRFWLEARTRWAGPRRTLGSLYARGLVSYSAAGWAITEAGRALLAELENQPVKPC